MKVDFSPLQRCFWNVKLDSLDISRSKDFIIKRVLHYGNMKQVEWLLRYYAVEDLAKVFSEDYYGNREIPEPRGLLFKGALIPEREEIPYATGMAKWAPTRRVPSQTTTFVK